MKYLIFFIIVGVCEFGMAKGNGAEKFPTLGSGELAYSLEGKYHQFQVIKKDGIEYSQCAEVKSKPCLAEKAVLTKKDFPKIESQEDFHPASIYCRAQDGVYLIALNAKKETYSFCQFKDRSMVNAWDLFYKHYPADKVK